MSRPRLAFGCANLGISWTTKDDLDALAATLSRVGVDHLDTAARYPPHSPGLAEKLMGENGLASKGFKIDTKIFVNAWDGAGSMAEGAVAQSISNSLQALKTNELNALYCHGPDRETPIAEQAAVIDRQYKKGVFKSFGVSNLDAAMLKEWLEVADQNGYIKPTIYQGQYNVLCRGWEDGLFPILRQHGMSFSGFSPLAGGFLTGKLTFADPVPDSLRGTRFEEADNNLLGKAFRRWYDKPEMHSAMQKLKASCEREGVSMMDASLRWTAYHSALKEGDEIVFGATKLDQIEAIAKAMADGPLSRELAADIDSLWDECKEAGMSITQY